MINKPSSTAAENLRMHDLAIAQNTPERIDQAIVRLCSECTYMLPCLSEYHLSPLTTSGQDCPYYAPATWREPKTSSAAASNGSLQRALLDQQRAP